MPEDAGAEQPVLDLTNLSWGDSKSLALLQLRMKEEAQDAASMEKVFAHIDRLLSAVLVSVPRSWLVRSAPEVVDWADPASIDWVQSKRVPDLVKALAAAKEPESASKN